MRFRLLGPLTACSTSGEPIAVGGPRPRTLLALLLLDAGRVVGVDALIDGVYGEQPPSGAANALQTQVSRLRRTLPEDVIERQPAGYRLAVDPQEVDAHRFVRLAADGAAALATGDAATAAELLDVALDLWRGPALAELGDLPSVAAPRARLAEQRLRAIEDRAAARLALGQGADLLPELRAVLAADPLRERVAALLMRALHGLGRGGEALAVFAELRARLAEELGADPSAELAETHLSILRGTTAAPRTLPVALTGLVGREGDLDQLADRLSRARLVTLVGPGGVGKTRLAIEAAQRVAGEVCFVELAPVSAAPGAVARAVLGALGLRQSGLLPTAQDRPDEIDRLAAALADRALLLVLDNCEHLVADAAGCVHALLTACPALRVLATSREGLAVTGEALHPVAPLALPPAQAGPSESVGYPALRLFRDRALAVDPGFTVDDANLSALHRICTALDGLPLAIELAAARLRTLDVAEIADRLDDRFGLLNRGSRAVAPRHRTLRAVVEWSWELLDEPARTLARRMSVFAGPAERADLAAVCAVPGIDQVLADLVDQSIVEGRGRYRMLDTIRAFCAEQLDAAGERPRLRRAHARHLLALATEADPHLRRTEQLDWLARLADRHDDLRAALAWSVEEDPELALRLIGALSWYWYLSGTRTEVAAHAARLLTALGPTPPAGLDQEYLLCALHADPTGSTDPDRRAALDRLMATLTGPVRQPYVVVGWGLTNGPPAALDEHDLLPILRAFVTGADPWGPAMSTLSISFTRWYAEGDLARAAAECAESLAGFRALGDRWAMAQAVESLAAFADARGDTDRAIALTDEALELVRELGAREELADMRCRRADRVRHAGRLAAAETDYRQAADLARTSGLRLVHALSQRGLAEIARERGDTETARELLDVALRECGRDWAGTSARARVHSALGRLAQTRGETEEAVREHTIAVVTARDNRNLVGLADALKGLSQALGDTERSARLAGIVHVLTSGADRAARASALALLDREPISWDRPAE